MPPSPIKYLEADDQPGAPIDMELVAVLDDSTLSEGRFETYTIKFVSYRDSDVECLIRFNRCSKPCSDFIRCITGVYFRETCPLAPGNRAKLGNASTG